VPALLAALLPATFAGAATVDPDRVSQRVFGGVTTAVETTPGLRPADAAFAPPAVLPARFPRGSGPHWLRLELKNPLRVDVERVLAVRFPHLDAVELHARLADGRLQTGAAGARLPVGEGLAPFPAFRLRLPPGESTIYLRIESAGVAAAPLELLAPTPFQRLVLRDHLMIGAVLGAGLVLALYLTLLAGGPRDDRHAAFLALTLSTLGHLLVSTGIGKVWFWPNSGVPTFTLVFIAQGLVLGSGAWFFRTVLRAGGLPPLVHRSLMLVSFAGFATLLAPYLPEAAIQALYAFTNGVAPTALFLLVLLLALGGRREAGVLALGWGPAQVVTLHAYLKAHDIAGFHPVTQYFGLGAFAALIAVYARDLSKEAQSAAVAAEHDPLTGLGNRTRMERAFRSLSSARGAEGVAVLAIDLDRFKALNDTLGHAAGDEALVEVSGRFRAVLRADDVLCRIGGDEFFVLIPYFGDEQALVAIAERLLAAVQAPIRTSVGNWTLGASVGIATGTQAADLQDLQRRADAALYRVKQTGRNAFRFADADAPEPAIRERRENTIRMMP
jgi:diguanylate cyclase (GGDEF)-like protein